MTPSDPTRTVHFALADALEGWTKMSDEDPDVIPSLTTIFLRYERDLNLRSYYVGVVLLAWFWIAASLP